MKGGYAEMEGNNANAGEIVNTEEMGNDMVVQGPSE